MARKSKIEWTSATWNPVTGCTKVSTGCANCYAERMAVRLQAMGNPRYGNGFAVTLHRDLLDLPLKWREPQMVFVDSMSDLFHEAVPDDFIRSVFNTIARSQQHIFQVLTKRSKRLALLAPKLTWPPNLWMGVTVECQSHIKRIEHLLATQASVKFLSAEPLLGPLNIDVSGLDWLVVGGESGPGARPMKKEWVVSLRDKCVEAQVAFFFKQWGGINKKRAGRVIDGKVWDEFPTYAETQDLTLIA